LLGLDVFSQASASVALVVRTEADLKTVAATLAAAPHRAQSCRVAVSMTRVGADEIQLRAYAQPL
jgi:hypothetical protein